MTTQPSIQGFEFFDRTSDNGGPPRLNVTITVPNGVVAATLLAHITALVQQYPHIQRQVEQAEQPTARQPDKIEDAASQTAPTPTPVSQPTPTPAAKTTTRKTPAKPAKKMPTRPEVLAAQEVAAQAKQTTLEVVPDAAPVPEKPVEAAPTPAPADAPAAESPPAAAEVSESAGSAETCPPDLAGSTSFRKVLEWMVANDYQTVDMVVAKCKEYAPHVIAIQRAWSGWSTDLDCTALKDRVTRGLGVVLTKGATA